MQLSKSYTYFLIQYVSGNLECMIASNNLSIKTKNGEDFLQDNDGKDRLNWNLYFREDNGIVTKGENLDPSQIQFNEYAVKIDGIAEQYLTQVKT